MKIRDSASGLITNAEVYGLDRTNKTCQYPMSINTEDIKSSERLNKLSKAKIGSGHDCALKGVIVRYDLNAPAYFWQQWQRYHFSDIVSSQSKMHRIMKMDLDSQCNKWVTPIAKGNLEELIEEQGINPTPEGFQRVVSNIPMGLNLKADCVSNLLQEKTKYNQRKNHKLSEWKEYCSWLDDNFDTFLT